MNYLKLALNGAVALLLGGCGTVVPNITEPYQNADDEPLMVLNIVRSVHCEVKNAIEGLLVDDALNTPKGQKPLLSWLYGWGVQINLNLTVEEKTATSPNVSTTTPLHDSIRLFSGGDKVVTSQSRSVGIGGTFSADATRVDKLFAFYKISDLASEKLDCRGINRNPLDGSLLLQANLGTRAWLADMVLLQNSGDVAFATKNAAPFNQNVISHEVKFEVVTEGNVTPVWKFVPISMSQGSAPFFDAKRDRTHDLTVTLGPIDKTGNQLAPTPFFAAVVSDFGATVGNATKSSSQP
ncbi:hypothetical protein [Rhodoblastus sp.]|uniref:hypothetical protein n=1 Tax=Rhodoblastus sp. TaxID=1962975 RepID=UPI003F9AA92C